MTVTPSSDPAILALTAAIDRLTLALGSSAGRPVTAPQTLDPGASRFAWRDGSLAAVDGAALPLDLLLGIDRQKERLAANVRQFAAGLPANHVLLWGAPGTGKSALAKAVHAAVQAEVPDLALVEVGRDDIASVATLLPVLASGSRPVLLFIDDLSFAPTDGAYRTLKTVLDGGISARPGTGRVLVVVTSNLRHLIDRDAMQASQARSQRPDEAAYEQIALSDRFGLWLGFHPMDQATYLAVVQAYCARFDIAPDDPGLERAALQWAQMRSSRSGRAAWQFVMDRAGRAGRTVSF